MYIVLLRIGWTMIQFIQYHYNNKMLTTWLRGYLRYPLNIVTLVSPAVFISIPMPINTGD